MMKPFMKYLLWAGVAGAGTGLIVNILFNGFSFLIQVILLTGAAGAIVGFIGGVAGHIIARNAKQPYRFGLVAAVVIGGISGFLALLLGCGLGC